MALSYDNTNYDLQSQLDLLNIHAITNKGTAATSGLYKIATNAEGHVTSATAVVKSDITALGIPAQDTVYTLPTATSSSLGGVKLGYTSSGKNYGVQIDSSGNLYVNVPWTDNNTTYSAGAGLSLSSTTFSLASISGLTAGTYGPSANVTGTDGTTISVPQITVDSYGRVTSIVNRTYTSQDKNTTYSNLNQFTNGPGYITGITKTMVTNALGYTPPTTNTTYSAATQSAAGLMSAADKKKLDGVATSANNYSHPTGAGNNHIPSGGSSGQFLGWSSAGAAKWVNNPNTDHYAWSDITSKPATATRWPSWSEVTSKPSSFTPASHTHDYLSNGASWTLVNWSGAVSIPMNARFIIVCQAWTVNQCGSIYVGLGGYAPTCIGGVNCYSSLSGEQYSFTHGSGTCAGFAIYKHTQN